MAAWRVLTSRPGVQAYIVLGALRAEGVRAYLQRDGLGVVYGLTAGEFATRILVAHEDYEAGQAVLREVEDGPGGGSATD